MKTFFAIFWRFLFVISVLSYADTASIIANGGFNHIALPPEMIPQEMVGNALQAIGWFTVLILSFRKNPLFAPELCIFLGGMLFFDVQTTWTLDMPLRISLLGNDHCDAACWCRYLSGGAARCCHS